MNSLFLPPAAQVQADQPLESTDEFVQIHGSAAGRKRQDFPAIPLPAFEEVFLVLAAPDDALDVLSIPAPEVADLQIAAGDRAGEDAARKIVLADLALPGGDHVADAAHALALPDRFADDAANRRMLGLGVSKEKVT